MHNLTFNFLKARCAAVLITNPAYSSGGAVSLLKKSPKLVDHAALWAAAYLEGELPAKICAGWF